MQKKALIIGISGQDGTYLAELLLQKGYEVHGLGRRSSSGDLSQRVKSRSAFLKNSLESSGKLFFHYGDLTDISSLYQVIEKIQPDEVYNLAAQSDVALSAQMPESAIISDGLGALKVMEAIKLSSKGTIKLCQAGSIGTYDSLLRVGGSLIPCRPNSPYAVSKSYAYWMGVNAREADQQFVANALLLNHESPRRGEKFVTKKISTAAVKIFLGRQKMLLLGNLDARRDWGHASDYVEALWLMLQQPEGGEYAVATGIQHTVREFCERCFSKLGVVIAWHGAGKDEVGVVRTLSSFAVGSAIQCGDVLVKVNSDYFRANDVCTEVSSQEVSGTMKKLNWHPKISFEKLVDNMVQYDLNRLRKQEIC